MKKLVRLTESDLVRLVKKVIKEQTRLMDQNSKGPSFVIQGNVEGDMVMKFDVYQFMVQGNKIGMVMKEKFTPLGEDKNRTLIVYDFGGPIFDAKTNKRVFTDVDFDSIGPNNYMSLAKKNGVPVIKK